MASWYLSCPKFTIQVDTKFSIITWAAPIARKFIGQKFDNLIRWSKADVVEPL